MVTRKWVYKFQKISMNKEGTNIEYWQKVLNEPRQAYKEWFEVEEKYLLENIDEHDFVLDLGCGNGKNIQIISKKTQHITGIDNDEIAVRGAKETFKDTSAIEIVLGDASSLPFPDATFDVVTNIHLIGNVGDAKDKIFFEASRALKHSGIMILSIHSEYAFEERMKMYEQIGIPIKKVEGTTVYLDGSVGAFISEQFSLDQLKEFGEKAGLAMIDHVKVGDLAYICKYKKN
jgi:ubiquinone/menaquinone biosynthesis C-methylase UbiE